MYYMNTHHISFYLKALLQVDNKEKFMSLLNSLESSFLPYATFSNHLLPLFESRVEEINKNFDKTPSSTSEFWIKELDYNNKLIEIGKFLEDERKTLSEKICKVHDINFGVEEIIRNQDYDDLITYLKDFNNKLILEDKIICDMLDELELLENYLEHIVNSVKEADMILHEWKEQFKILN